MTDNDVYGRLAEWLGNTWWKLTESAHMMPMLTSYITPEEAAFLTGIPFSPSAPEELAAIKDMDLEKILPLLEVLTQKGLLYVTEGNEGRRYRLNDSFFIFLRAAWWSGIDDEAHRDLAHKVNSYFFDGWFDQFKSFPFRGLRTIPIEQTVTCGSGKAVLPLEDIVQIIDHLDYHTVSSCPCRMRHNLDPTREGCDHPVENCLHFGDLGRYCVQTGIGREISKEETIEILKAAADAGLVHGLSNGTDRPDTICNCCNDACMWFVSYRLLGHDGSLQPSHYRVKEEPLSCKACALCVKRCPMDALSLVTDHEAKNKFKKSVAVDIDKCIGCGVCVHKCPTNALSLIEMDEAVGRT